MFTVFKTTNWPLFSFGLACKTEFAIECCLETLNWSSASQAHITQAMSPGRICHQNPRLSKLPKGFDCCVAKRLIFGFLVWGAEKKTPFMTPSGVGKTVFVFVSCLFVFCYPDRFSSGSGISNQCYKSINYRRHWVVQRWAGSHSISSLILPAHPLLPGKSSLGAK